MYSFIEQGSITTTPGFSAAGIYAGIKKKRKDLALIYSQVPCSVAGTFTINKVKAAPLLLSKEVISNGNKVKAVWLIRVMQMLVQVKLVLKMQKQHKNIVPKN